MIVTPDERWSLRSVYLMLLAMIAGPLLLFLCLPIWQYISAVPADCEFRIKKGMTAQEVLKIAGRPYHRSPEHYFDRDVEVWLYSVRYREGFGVYSDPLCLKFKNGRCIMVEQY